ncbi:Transcriptional activator, adenine-specific DNA methyltransferase [Mycobacteroides abscessus subsp. abscessus]|uniref:MT-A70 family methyltransferase n=1 Tax=Mycobacteroides abscessus TaxID=36809 RepID=UPI0005E7AF58|nr:MT-A70 family methyltransferase [Mycobacteroides abscessus]MDO3046318.1 MT-A70 family methyltransferase [Mycobacteroides abscessus subsp. abscessus]MDO3137455.1 MT-A70 family methyltransferase [Mycobacteroides abscessus subsp. abscessus]MDO3154945.1 MT-A70 family methyltransferase [Mycobacteroides abscessus subsp. abscessus]CPS18038.1 Transcriptional activator%2C adenine-specific DNA methyltransferase [Mycobacteroides abscessus]CPS49668.1 Transcriptional activator%2C adenine-specific DNA me
MPLPTVPGGFRTVLADPPWRFGNRRSGMSPESGLRHRYHTMALDDICDMPVSSIAADAAHLYLWVPSAMLPEGLEVMQHWGFRYTTSITWLKTRRDGEPDGSGVGFYFRNATELLLFGVRGSLRTLPAARGMTNVITARRREHSRKPTETYWLIEQASPGPRLELFARQERAGWTVWGDESDGVSVRFRTETHVVKCPVCATPLAQPSTGRRRQWCSEACRFRYRRAVTAES